MKGVMSDLMQQRPTTVDHKEKLPLPDIVVELLDDLDWVESSEIRLHESGMLIQGDAWILPRLDSVTPAQLREATELIHGPDWKLHDVVVTIVDDVDRKRDVATGEDPRR